MKISCQSCGAKYNIADEKVRGKIVKIACKKCGARIEIDGRENAESQDEARTDNASGGMQGGQPASDAWTVSVDDNDQRECTTPQLIDLYREGVVNADTFVWREGMADWQALREVDALRGQLAGPSAAPAMPAYPAVQRQPTPPPLGGNGSYGMPDAAAAFPASQSRPPSAYASQSRPPAATASRPPGGGYDAQSARLGGSRRGGAVDLFGGGAPSEDEDVATSAPAGVSLGGMAESIESGKPIGARNENSVLFSLAALTSSGPGPAVAAVPGDEEKSGLIDIQKLAASAKSPGRNDNRAKLDDIMNLGGGGAFGAALGAPILAPPPPTAMLEAPEEYKKQNPKILYGLIGVGAVIVLLLLVIVLKPAKEAEKKEDNALKAVATTATETKPLTPTVATTSEPTPVDPGGPTGIGKPGTKPAGGTAAAPGKPTTPGPATGATTAAPPDKPTTPTKPGCKTLEECMGAGAKPPGDKPPAPSGGGAEFDKGAAKSALSGVPYKDCGSGGAGKVSVTFGPSGSVSGASVTAGDYEPGTKSCIQSRFRSAKVPSFSGDPKTVGWSINL